MGFVQGGTAIVDGGNLKIQGVTPTGIAAQGEVIYRDVVLPQWTLLSYASGQASPYTLDTTGASLIVVTMGVFVNPAASVSDNQGNTWTPFGQVGGSPFARMFYCINPVTSSQHTISATGNFSGTIVSAFAGPASPVTGDGSQDSVSGTPLTVQLPPITPVPNSLVVAMMGLNCPSVTIDQGFEIIAIVPRTGNIGVAAAFLVAADSTELAPTWTTVDNASGDNPVIMLSFNPPVVPWELLTSTSVSSGASTDVVVTTPAVDTTGATLLVVAVAEWGTAGPVTDSQNNVWTRGPTSAGNFSARSTLWYCIGPVTDATHTFTFEGGYPAVGVGVFGGPSATVDQSSFNPADADAGGTVQAVPITPSAANALVLCGYASNNNPVLSIDSGFTIVVAPGASDTERGGLAYLAQQAAAEVAPTWTIAESASVGGVATMLSFGRA